MQSIVNRLYSGADVAQGSVATCVRLNLYDFHGHAGLDVSLTAISAYPTI